MKTDKFLLGIVVGIVLLVAATLVVVFTRPTATYQPENMPEGVVHNYILAIQEEDYPRAYEYLSPNLVGYPDSSLTFKHEIENYTWSGYEMESLSIESSVIHGDKADVTISALAFYRGDLFSSGQSTYSLHYELEQVNGEWKIISGDNYFAWCWTQTGGCR